MATAETIDTTEETPAPEPETEQPEQPDELAELRTKLDAKNRKEQEIIEAEQDVAAAEREWKDLKEQAKEAKEAFDDAVSRMRSIIRKHARGEQELPFPPDDETPAPKAEDPAATAKVGEALALTESQADALSAVDVDTVLDFEKLLQKHGMHWHQQVKGVAEKTAEKIVDKYNAWRSVNPPPEEAEAGPQCKCPQCGKVWPYQEGENGQANDYCDECECDVDVIGLDEPEEHGLDGWACEKES